MIEFDPQLYVVRFFNEINHDEEYPSFDAVCTLHKMEGIGLVSGMHGVMTREAYTAFKRECKALGITKLLGYRHDHKEPTEWHL
jgi:hypothetical protein